MFSRRVAIDLGTAYSVVAHPEAEDFWRTASSIAYCRESQKAVAFGDEAKKMFGRCPDKYDVILPLKDGVIADFAATKAYVDHLLGESCRHSFLRGLDVFMCVPWGATDVELRSYQRGLRSGRRNIRLVREPFAAALGCDHNILDTEPVTLVDMGGGTTEVATLSEGIMWHASSLRSAGRSCDYLVRDSLMRAHQFELGLNMSEAIKIQHGSVWREENDYDIEIRGTRRDSRKPENFLLGSEELRLYLEPHALKVEQHISQHINQLPTDAQNSLEKNGLILCGGTSLLKGWDARLKERLKLPVRRAPEPIFAVIRGMKKIIENPRAYRSVLRISEACLS